MLTFRRNKMLTMFGYFYRVVLKQSTNFSCLSEAFSTKKYFGMFALIAIFPLVYTVLIAYSGFPSIEQNFDKGALQNESLVKFLELNITDVQQFNLFVPNDQQVNTYHNCKFLKRFQFNLIST